MAEPLLARICCLDLDTFFVSVERLLNPALIGKPVVVGGPRGGRGVVVACSYEVRAFGVRAGMSVKDASALAPPDAVFMSGTHGVYTGYAQRVRAIARDLTPESRVASIDEMYLDFRGCEALYRQTGDVDDDATILRTCRALTARIQADVGLPASCGIGATKTIAKVASGLAKPAGVLLVPKGTERAFLAPLGVRKLPGIGPVGEERLHALGIRTLAEVGAASVDVLRPLFGVRAEDIHARAQGLPGIAHRPHLGRERPAFREHDAAGDTAGSISNERTFAEDLTAPRDVEARLCGLVERVCWRARQRGVLARTATLKLRTADFVTVSRSKSFTATASERDVLPVVIGLYAAARPKNKRVRLVGVQLSKLTAPSAQLALALSADERLHHAVDTLRARYGFDAVGVAEARRARRHER